MHVSTSCAKHLLLLTSEARGSRERCLSETIQSTYCKDVAALTVHIAEAACLALLRVVKTTRPVDGNVALAATQSRGAL
jgi:hypothetical protein